MLLESLETVAALCVCLCCVCEGGRDGERESKQERMDGVCVFYVCLHVCV